MTDVEDAQPGHAVHFVVVDDHAIIAAAMAGMLCQSFPGAQVKIATTMDAAMVAVAEPVGPGVKKVVLLDLTLGDGNGLEFLRAVRERPDLSAIRTVVLSGNRAQEKIDECRIQGANGYVAKTDDTEVMLRAIRAALCGGEYFTTGDVSPVSALQARIASLSPRLRLVYDGIMAGKADKDIARELDLEYSTVKGYTNQIYRQLEVRNRKELLAAPIQK